MRTIKEECQPLHDYLDSILATECGVVTGEAAEKFRAQMAENAKPENAIKPNVLARMRKNYAMIMKHFKL